ncbi:hypothetical protein [Thalassospira lucentensis]|uniref:hypothetical protein n=1 Tax=Thalassospira lucentensis TaxID=168935 RepID=UPI00142DAF9B|nr:hypothetical protein [Thalassospira lucentensis]NIZ01284.1 hypothetical protein [Thalassospira lucentensis]
MNNCCRAMDRITQSLYPVWLIAANLTARLGGMMILLILGHGFAADQLGSYFNMLAIIGLGVTCAQAGTGPLLIRLQQAQKHHWALAFVGLRVLIALTAVLWITFKTNGDIAPLGQYWPLLLIPITAALSPDWVISARTEFSRFSVIALVAQTSGIIIATSAALFGDPHLLFAVAPTISIASFVASIVFAFLPTQAATPQQTKRPSPAPTPSWQACFGLIGFTLFAGLLPNLDFVLLASDSTLFLAQRVFLICAAFLAAISSALFAKQQSDHLRDIWLLGPMAGASLLLWVWPGLVAGVIYTDPSDELISLLQTGALWPVLLALLSRHILILQENPAAMWVGWLCLCGLLVSAAFLTSPTDAKEVLVFMQLRLGVVLGLLYLCNRQHVRRVATS